MNTSDILVHTYTFQYAGNDFIVTSAFINKQVMEGESIMYGEFTVALDKLGLIQTSEYIYIYTMTESYLNIQKDYRFFTMRSTFYDAWYGCFISKIDRSALMEGEFIQYEN